MYRGLVSACEKQNVSNSSGEQVQQAVMSQSSTTWYVIPISSRTSSFHQGKATAFITLFKEWMRTHCIPLQIGLLMVLGGGAGRCLFGSDTMCECVLFT